MNDDNIKKLLNHYKAPPFPEGLSSRSIRALANARQWIAQKTLPAQPFWDWKLTGYTVAFSLVVAVVIGVILGYGQAGGIFANFNGWGNGGIGL